MNYMYLYILFTDKRIEKHIVKRFSDLSQTKSKFYYYEEPHDTHGKGKSFLREDIICFELTAYKLHNWEKNCHGEQE